MADKNYSKVIYDGTILIDLTADTVTAAGLASGLTAHDKSGAIITGTSTYDATTTDATATAAEILSGKTAYVNKSKVTGTMTNRGAVTGTISTKAGTYTIPSGYHDGSGKVSISSTEQAKIVAGNIKQGISLLGVTGTYTGKADLNIQSKTVTPASSSQTVVPDSNMDYLSQVTVNAIPYAETQDANGGYIVTIAG